MDAGYFSEAAVRDLLAVKNGEIDFLKKQITQLTAECTRLAELVHKQENGQHKT